MAATTNPRKLSLSDIADLREYERDRLEYREKIIALKARRRVSVGPIVTLVFENRDTMKFQIQEMARVERLMTDEAIQGELDVYNPLIPDPGHLQATLMLELTTKEELMEWLPKLVGIERAVKVRIGAGGGDQTDVVSIPEKSHEAQLTREETTASVHYVGFEFTPDQVERFGKEPVSLVIEHEHYNHATPLGADTIQEMLSDLKDD